MSLLETTTYTSTERNWLSWLVKIRIIVLAFVFLIELLVIRLTRTQVPLHGFVGIVVVWLAIAIAHAALVALWKDVAFQSRLQVLTDLVLATAVVYVTGGIDTSFNFLYPLIIIVASILLPRWWAYLTAALAFIGFGAAVELPFFGFIPSYSATRPDLNSPQQLNSLQLVIVINLFAFLLIAALSSTLVAKLRQVDSELQGTSGALLDLQALHANVIYSMSDGLITTDLEGRVTLLNRAGELLLGCTMPSVSGQPVYELFRDPLPQTDSSIVHGEVRGITPGGEHRTFRITAAPLQTADRGLVGYVYSFGDLTEIRRLEHEVRMRDRLAAVGRMAAGIAHEIRNPLSSIAGSINVLSQVTALNDDQQTLVDIITRESTRLNSIISDFLVYSREKSFKFSRMDVIPLMEDALVLLSNRSQTQDLRIVREYALPEAFVAADPDRLKQVFWNLLENAVRAMKGKGVITVSVRVEGDFLRIGIRDTGPGIPLQLTEKIFEPFQSQFEGGTGLGLAIVYQIVQAHGAKIYVQSTLGEGAEFILEMLHARAAEADSELTQ